MFLHALSRRLAQDWAIRVDGKEYERIVRGRFSNRCPYCLCDLAATQSVIEHLDGMNRYRVGLHVPGNVLVACRRCNGEKRRDDANARLSLAESGWASFLSHDGSRCRTPCPTCSYWEGLWPDAAERATQLRANLERIQTFRHEFREFEQVLPVLRNKLPGLLTKLYSDCQTFAQSEIASLLEAFEQAQEARAEKSSEAPAVE